MLKLNELIGSTIVATDGELGKVKDAIFDDRTWAIRYLVVDAGSWLSSHEVVLAPHSVSRVRPSDETLTVRSFQEVKNYNLCAGDDEFGHVDDLMVEENEWVIRYLDVDTLNYVPSKHVFLRPDDVSDLDWAEQLFRLRLSRDQVLGAPTAPPR